MEHIHLLNPRNRLDVELLQRYVLMMNEWPRRVQSGVDRALMVAPASPVSYFQTRMMKEVISFILDIVRRKEEGSASHKGSGTLEKGCLLTVLRTDQVSVGDLGSGV